VVTLQTSLSGASPAISPILDQRLLALPVWGFLVPTVWGFNARWLPGFLGLRPPKGRLLLVAVAFVWIGVLSAAFSQSLVSGLSLIVAAGLAAFALHIFQRPEKPAKIEGIHPAFSAFIKMAYVWLSIAVVLSAWAAESDTSGGIWGASRHAVTVGFLGAMVFAIGQRILPAFCGAQVLFSKDLMLGSLLLLNVGCAMRVCSEIPAYEGFVHTQLFWRLLPISAISELTAVTLFAANLIATFGRPTVGPSKNGAAS
jgi:hypothetical protein